MQFSFDRIAHHTSYIGYLISSFFSYHRWHVLRTMPGLSPKSKTVYPRPPISIINPVYLYLIPNTLVPQKKAPEIQHDSRGFCEVCLPDDQLSNFRHFPAIKFYKVNTFRKIGYIHQG